MVEGGRRKMSRIEKLMESTDVHRRVRWSGTDVMGEEEGGRERKREKEREREKGHGVGRSYYKNPQNNRRGGH